MPIFGGSSGAGLTDQDYGDVVVSGGGTVMTLDVVEATTMQIKVIDDATAVTTGDAKLVFVIPPELNGYNLTDADGYITTVSSSGEVSGQIRNVTDSVDMLSLSIYIEATEYTSYTAATANQPVIDTAHDDVATGDLIAVDVNAAGTGAKGLGVVLTFTKP